MIKKILVIEDDLVIQDLMMRRFRRIDYDVFTASNGLEGIKIAQTQFPDIILMDMRLPVMDGWEAVQLLKSSSDTQHIPIIALTAQTLEEDQMRCFEVGCDDYASKPVQFTALLAKIENLLEKNLVA